MPMKSSNSAAAPSQTWPVSMRASRQAKITVQTYYRILHRHGKRSFHHKRCACRVLDLGMNAGFFALQCVRLGEVRVVGLDKSPSACAQGTICLCEVGLRTLKSCRADFMSAPDGRFDICLVLTVLHHLADIRPYPRVGSPKGGGRSG